MEMTKRTSVRGEWAKKGEDIKDGDVVQINDSGEVVTGEYGDRTVFRIQTRNGEKLLSFNQTTVNNLVDAYGKKSEAWVGKNATVFIIKAMVSGKFTNVVYLAGEGWGMSDDGKFHGPANKNVEIDEEEIKIEDVPF